MQDARHTKLVDAMTACKSRDRWTVSYAVTHSPVFERRGAGHDDEVAILMSNIELRKRCALGVITAHLNF